jgi:hypothetical protein
VKRMWVIVVLISLSGGFVLEGLGVLFESEKFSLTAALGMGAFFVALASLLGWVEENVKRPLTKFVALAFGLTMLLVVIAPLGRGDAADPMPTLLLTVGIPALLAALDRPFKRWERWAEDQRRHHSSP